MHAIITNDAMSARFGAGAANSKMDPFDLMVRGAYELADAMLKYEAKE